jgi:hypothetical protein
MLVRKLVIVSFVLAAIGLTVTVTTVVIGQQPGTAEKSPGVAEKKAPAEVPTSGATGLLRGAGEIAPPSSNDNIPAVAGESAAGTSSTSDDEAGAKAPPAGSGPPAGSTSGAPMTRGKAVTKKTKSGASAGGAMKPGGMSGMPGMAGMPAGGGGVPAGGGMPGMMPGMMGSGPMPPVSEDERLETWVNRALADYVQTEDQNARKEQREQIAQALDRIFDIRQERRMEELESLEQRVQKLRATLETRDKLKSDILKNRLDYLIREADGLGWGDGPPTPAGMRAPSGMGTGSGPTLPKRPAKGSSDKKTSDTPSGASAPRKGLEFLAAYPKFFGLSLEMTEPQFLDIVANQKLKAIKNSSSDGTKYLVPTGDGHTVIVMFGHFDNKCGGIQRVRGEAADDGKVDEAPRPEGRERGRSTGGSGAGRGSSSEGSNEELPKQ